MFKYVGTEYLFRAADRELYALEFESPAEYETEEEAEKDTTALRFEKDGYDVKLIVYSGTWSIIEDAEKGGKVMRTVPSGQRIAEYTYEEFSANLRNKVKRYAGPSGRDEFVPEYTSFDDLFPDLDDGQSVFLGTSCLFYVFEI